VSRTESQERALAASAAVVAEPWVASSYYAAAEEATETFWGAGSPFRRLFAELDATVVVELACGHG
jgi:hypothetical protein